MYTNSNSVKNYKLIIFSSISNIALMSLIAFPILIINYKNLTWFVIILLSLMMILLSLFFKGFSKDINILKYLKTNLPLRIILTIYTIIVISLLSISTGLIIKRFFYIENSILFIGSIILLVSVYLSNSSINKIISSAFILFIFVLLLYIIPFATTSVRNFDLLLPLKIETNNLYYSIIVLTFPLENSLMLIFTNSTEKGIQTKDFIISNIITLGFLLLISIDSLTLLSSNFLSSLKYPSFFRWNFLSGNKLFQNYDFLIYIILIITVVYRLTYYIKILKISLFLKQKRKQSILLYIILLSFFLFLYLNINNISIIFEKMLYFMFFLILLIFAIFANKSMEVKKIETTQ